MRPKYTRLTCTGDYGYRFHFNSIAKLWLDFTEGELDPRVTFTRASGGTRINEQGQLEVVPANQPRFDHHPVTLAPLGLLIEEQRTNSIRNNTMQGAVVGVVGAGGALPTNWGTVTFNGLQLEVLATGLENGINYIELRITGTPVAVGPEIRMDSGNVIAALPSQSWAISSFLRLVQSSGATPGFNLFVAEFASNGTYLTGGSGVVPTSAAMARGVFTRVLQSASVAFVRPSVSFTVSTSQTYDFTVRIGLPQLELGAFATSVIPTTTAAATRAADVAVMTGTNFSDWYNQSEGTFFVEVVPRTLDGGVRRLMSVNDGSINNRIDAYYQGSGVNTIVSTIGGVEHFTRTNSQVVPVNSNHKLAHSYSSSGGVFSSNGSFAFTLPYTATPAVDRLNIGSNALFTQAAFLNGHIKRIGYSDQSHDPSILVAATKP